MRFLKKRKFYGKTKKFTVANAREGVLPFIKNRSKRYKACSDLVEVTGVEPVSESALTETSPGAEGHLHSLVLPQAFML